MSERMNNVIKIFELILLAVLAVVGIVIAIGFFQLNLARLPGLIEQVEELSNLLKILLIRFFD